MLVVGAEHGCVVCRRGGVPEIPNPVGVESRLPSHRLDRRGNSRGGRLSVVGLLGLCFPNEGERVVRGDNGPMEDAFDTGRGIVQHAGPDAEPGVRLNAGQPVLSALVRRPFMAFVDRKADVFSDVHPPPVGRGQEDPDEGEDGGDHAAGLEQELPAAEQRQAHAPDQRGACQH